MNQPNNEAGSLDETKLSQVVPTRTAGQLPSSKTVSLLTTALESDNLDDVKAALVHTWLHYQSLEFLVSGADLNADSFKEAFDGAVEEGLEQDIDLLAFVTRGFAGQVVDAAYQNAHQASFFMEVFGVDPQGALQMIYGALDFSDPDQEAAVDKAAADAVAEAESILRSAITVPDVVADELAHPDEDGAGEPGTEPTA